MRSLILFLLLFSLSNSAFSLDYYWSRTGSSVQHSSPLAACESIQANFPASYVGVETTTFINPTLMRCGVRLSSQPNLLYVDAQRYGDSCQPDFTYNPTTGECDPPPVNECEEKAGDSVPYSKSGDMDDGYITIVTIDGKKQPVSPNEGCMGGCAVTVQDRCKTRISTNAYSCTGYAYYSGTACTASTEAPQVEQEENYRPDEPENIEIKEPCVYTTDAEGRSVCVSKASLEKEGQNCGSYMGESLCVPKVATKDETSVETEVTETSEPDGGKTTVKKDVATVTKCVNNNKSCTTTTTTTTTTTKSDGSGTTTKTDVVCKGTACGSGTGGVGSGDGSGEGDCTTDDCGDDDITTPDLDEDVLGYGEATSAFMDRVSGSPMLSAVGSIGLSGNGSCSMSSASTVIGTISADSFCDNSHWLDPLYFVFLAIHALAAVRVFLSA